MNYSFEFDSAILNINEGFGQNYCNILSKGSVSLNIWRELRSESVFLFVLYLL
jgi:hypothetical protein